MKYFLPNKNLICLRNLFISFLNNLFYFWLCWVFVAARGLFSGCGERGLLFVVVCRLVIVVASLVVEHGLQICGLQQLWHTGFSSCALRALERRFSSCGTQAQLLHSMWDPPRPGLEPNFTPSALQISFQCLVLSEPSRSQRAREKINTIHKDQPEQVESGSRRALGNIQHTFPSTTVIPVSLALHIFQRFLSSP